VFEGNSQIKRQMDEIRELKKKIKEVFKFKLSAYWWRGYKCKWI